MNNVKSAREVLFQNYFIEKMKALNNAFSSSSSRHHAVNKTKSLQLTWRSQHTVTSNLKPKHYSSTSRYISILKRNLIKHSIDNLKYIVKIVNDIIYDKKTHMVSLFKDSLLWDETSDFLKRFYSRSEYIGRMPKICRYYERYTLMRPVYFKLSCMKIMHKNMKKHKKLLEQLEDNEEEYEDAEQTRPSHQYSKLIQTSIITNSHFSKIDQAEDKKSEKEKHLSASLSLNCNEISDQAVNNNIATLSNIINDISLSASTQDDKKKTQPPQQQPSPRSKGQCYTEGQLFNDHTTTSHSNNSNLTLNAQANKKEKYKTMKIHWKNIKRINIKKLDLKNINHIVEEMPMPLSQCTETNTTNRQLTQCFTTLPSASQERKPHKPTSCIFLKRDIIKKNINSIVKVLQTKAIFERSSITQKKIDSRKSMNVLSKGEIKMKMMAAIKKIVANAKTERTYTYTHTHTRQDIPHKNSIKSINPLVLSKYSKQVRLVNKQQRVIIRSCPNITHSSIFNINVNLNLNLNMQQNTPSRQIMKSRSKSKFPNAIFKTQIKTDRVFSPPRTGNKNYNVKCQSLNNAKNNSKKIIQSPVQIKHESSEIYNNKSINLKKNVLNRKDVDVTRKYPLTSRNEKEKIQLKNNLAVSHK